MDLVDDVHPRSPQLTRLLCWRKETIAACLAKLHPPIALLNCIAHLLCEAPSPHPPTQVTDGKDRRTLMVLLEQVRAPSLLAGTEGQTQRMGCIWALSLTRNARQMGKIERARICVSSRLAEILFYNAL